MCWGGSSPKPPAPIAPPPQASVEMVDPEAANEANKFKMQRRAAGGLQSTILASASSNFMAPTGQVKTALGQ